MKKIFNLLFGVLLVLQFSCIDRDTIAGTGKEIPDSITGAGGDLQVGIVNGKLAIPLKVKILASNGRPVRGVIVEFSVQNNNAIFSDTNATTNGDGYAQTTVTLGAKADSVRIYASVLGLKGSPIKFTLFASSSRASTIELISGDNQTGEVGSTLPIPLKVKVTDLYGNPSANSVVYFLTNNGTLQPLQSVTDSLGFALSIWKLDTTVGNKEAHIFLPSIVNGTINITAKAISLLVPSYFYRISSDTLISLQSATIKNILQVRVLDNYKNPVYREQGGLPVHFTVTEGMGTVNPIFSYINIAGNAFANVSLAFNDTILKIVADVGFGLPAINFTFFAYKYSQIDSLKSSGGIVTLYWQKNLNPNFANYTLERCNNFNFDNTTIEVKVISDENIVSTEDHTAVVGSSPFYRIKMNYTNGFYFYTNLRDIFVNP